MFILKKKAQARIADLQAEVNHERYLASQAIKHADESARQAAHWRARAEAAESSPEIKADTEAAFSRGRAHKGNQVRSGIVCRTRPDINSAIDELRDAVNKHLNDLERGCHEESSAGTVVINGQVPVDENVAKQITDEIKRTNKTRG